ncbi:g4982 [Coccomyxa elongata]
MAKVLDTRSRGDLAQTRALWALYDQQPLMLLSGDTFADCETRLDSLCDILRSTHGAGSLPRDSYELPPLSAADLADLAADTQRTAAPARIRQRPAIAPGFEPRAATAAGAQEQEQDGGFARKAALSAMTRPRQPTLRLLSLNVNGLQDKDKKRWLFNLLERDKWDVILLQETHHRSPEKGAAWAGGGAKRAPLQLERARFLELLPSLPADRQLLVGGDFNCIAGQQDMLDPASPPGQRTLGYWTGLSHVETDHSLYDVWRELNSDR